MKLDIYNIERVEKTRASNGNLRIVGILHDIDDYVLLEKPHRFYKLYYENNSNYGGVYFRKNGTKYYLENFFRE